MFYNIWGYSNYSLEKCEIVGRIVSFGLLIEKRWKNRFCWIFSKFYVKGGCRYIEYCMGNWECCGEIGMI